MDSAEGQVQQMHYVATFPLLLNISDQPTYFMAMKDAAELVKMYAMVNVNQYQIVATGATVAECEKNYRQMLVQNGLIDEDDGTLPDAENDMAVVSASGEITEIRSAVIDGNTVYFLRLDDGSEWYSASASDVPMLVLLNVGDTVTLGCYDAAGGIAQTIYSVEVK